MNFVTELGALADVHGAAESAERRVREVFDLERELWRWCYGGDAGS